MLAALLAAACENGSRDLAAGVEAGIERGLYYLYEQQHRDGRWRSQRYAALRDDPVLTAIVVKALEHGIDPGASDPERERGMRALLEELAAPAEATEGVARSNYPVYELATSLLALARRTDEAVVALRRRLVAELRRHQLTEERGWAPEDLAYGGFGYSRTPPKRPEAGGPPPAFDADLSSTLFAVGALRLAGVPADEPALAKALVFVERCQNLPAEGTAPDPRFDDGGFFFAPTQEAANKAGVAGVDAGGRQRFRSYGSATADGIRALLRCGVAPDDRRVRTAVRWLGDHFSARTNPGDFDPSRVAEREGSFHYYAWSLAHACRALGIGELPSAQGPVRWPEALAVELLRRQRHDGSWSNRFTVLFEDDPIVATPLGVAALSLCRLFL